MKLDIKIDSVDESLAKQGVDFLKSSAETMHKLNGLMIDSESFLGPGVCWAQVNLCDGSADVLMTSDSWLLLASMWPYGLQIEKHWREGPESEKPWAECRFKASLKYNGITYYTIMKGSDIDESGLVIEDKEVLLYGEE